MFSTAGRERQVKVSAVVLVTAYPWVFHHVQEFNDVWAFLEVVQHLYLTFDLLLLDRLQ